MGGGGERPEGVGCRGAREGGTMEGEGGEGRGGHVMG